MQVNKKRWEKAQVWETAWHGAAINSFGEEEKQLLYANRMGLKLHHNGKSPYNIECSNLDIIDIGGGPSSLLLKALNGNRLGVVDPMRMPEWVGLRYDAAGINHVRRAGEDLEASGYDEAWIYNVLQHTEDPEAVILNARSAAKLIRIFEWIDTPTNVGHIHTLTEQNLNEWLGGYGKVEQLTGQAGCYGKCYYGIFPT